MLEKEVARVAEILWSPPMAWFVLGASIYFTVRMKAPQLLRIREMARYLVRGGDSREGVSSFQAFSMALGGRVGVGNIAGVATAIHFGGPGALFWMWMTALVGAAVAVVESSLAQVWKVRVGGEYRGGPAYYIHRGLGWRWLAVVYAVAAVFAFAVTGPSIQAFNIADTAQTGFGIDARIVGFIVAGLFCLVVFGGMHRIGRVCALVVPFMAVAYILLGVVILVMDAERVPHMFALIFASAFGQEAAFGGMLGAVIMWGVRRAVYSSEAGTGSGAQAAAAAEVSHPVKQGLAQGFSVYIDTLFVCTITGLMILVTDCYNVVDPSGAAIVSNVPDLKPGSAYTQAAIDSVMPGMGAAFVAVAMFFFAFTTLLSFGFYSDTNTAFLFGGGRWEKAAGVTVKVVLAISIVLGSFRSSEFAWNLADIGVGLYTWINLIALVLLSPKALVVFKDYVRQRKAGQDPTFDPSELGLEHAQEWHEVARRRAARDAQAPSR